MQKFLPWKEKRMELELIYNGHVTIEDLIVLNDLGFEFVVEGGVITNVLHR